MTLTRDYFVQRTPVTQGQWAAVMGAWNGLDPVERTMSGWAGETPVFGTEPSYFGLPEGEINRPNCDDADCPVERVSWWDAVVYANALSALEGLEECYTLTGCGEGEGVAGVGGGCSGTTTGCISALTCSAVDFVGKDCTGYRLLTEAEWERAARGGTETATYNGDLAGTSCGDSAATLDPIAWYTCNSALGGPSGERRTHAVGGKDENAWGLYDMLGNVWESTWTWYATAHSGGEDPLGPETGSFRVLRGGTWGDDGSFARAAGRSINVPVNRGLGVGFRLARSAPVDPALDCGAPDAAANGSVSAPETGFQDIATYSCNEGYVLVGDETRTCLSSGDWSGEAPVCLEEVDLGEVCQVDAQCPSGTWCPTDTSEARCSPRPVYDLGGDPIALKFQWVPSGEFTMGSPGPDDPIPEVGREPNEDQVSVTLTRDYFVQRTPVTQGQWAAVMEAWNALDPAERTMSGWAGETPVFGTEPSYFGLPEGVINRPNCDDADCPVERVSWWDAVVYANALSALEGLDVCYTLSGCGAGTGVAGVGGGCSGPGTFCNSGVFSCSSVSFVGKSCTGYRLLTEAEWERAARGGTETATYNGDLAGTDCALSEAVLDPIAWYTCNSALGGPLGERRPHGVGGKAANAWGLHDMLGNVWDWTWTWYEEAHSGGEDPLGPETGSTRVLRGGSWSSDASRARAAGRLGNNPGDRINGAGFRLARTSAP